VTLAQRLLVAIGLLTVATTATLALGLREAWRSAEEEQFQEAFALTADRLRGELAAQARALPALVEPLCRHDPTIDAALVDLQAGTLDPGRRLALSLRVPEVMRAFAFDELWLVTGRGEILGAGHDEGLTGQRDPALAAQIGAAAPKRARLRRDAAAPALVTHCRHSRGAHAVGLVAARRLDTLLTDLQPPGVTLSLVRPAPDPDHLIESLVLPELDGLTAYATQSRVPLHRALRRLDATILAVGGVTIGAALLLALLLARGLARPIVKLSAQAREVVHGEPRPVSEPSSESASAKPIEMPAPIEAATPTRKVSQVLCVANAAAKSGASVETEPSIRPARPGCTICRRKRRCVASSSLSRAVSVRCSPSSSSARCSWLRSASTRSPRSLRTSVSRERSAAFR